MNPPTAPSPEISPQHTPEWIEFWNIDSPAELPHNLGFDILNPGANEVSPLHTVSKTPKSSHRTNRSASALQESVAATVSPTPQPSPEVVNADSAKPDSTPARPPRWYPARPSPGLFSPSQDSGDSPAQVSPSPDEEQPSLPARDIAVVAPSPRSIEASKSPGKFTLAESQSETTSSANAHDPGAPEWNNIARHPAAETPHQQSASNQIILWLSALTLLSFAVVAAWYFISR